MSLPALRFKDVDGRDFPEWTDKEVGEVFKVTRGNVLAMPLVNETKTDTHQYPVYSSQTKNNGLSGYYNEYLYENSITWTTDGANAGDVNFRGGKFYCTNVCGVLISKDGQANACIAAMINAVSRKFVSYVGNPKLMNGVMAKITIEFPCVKEQTKIANFLTAVDEKITQLTQKHYLLTQYKKGVMQQIFSQELRFKDDDGKDFPEWKKKKISEMAQIAGGGTPDTTVAKYWQGNIQWFTPTEIKSKYASNSLRTITEAGLKNSSAKVLPIGTLLFSSRATVGDVSIALRECTTNQGFQSFIVNNENNNEFIYYWILNNKKVFLEKATGSTFLEISKKEIDKLMILCPCIKEQTKIAKFFTAIDDKITNTQTQLNAVKQYKLGLLQQMFV
ncbi:RMtype1_S_EcoJA69PI-TRD1-CR1_like domain containing protein [Methylophilaceae bacterium]